MELEIRALTPELLGDYLEFFDHVAFSDHPEWASCYCLAFHFEPAWDAEDAGLDNPWRERAIQFVRKGKLKGYLAYADGKVSGWCNANDKSAYSALAPELCEPDNQAKKILSVVCFLVAPNLRGKGIATKLLERACTDAEAAGYDFIEVYPPSGECDQFEAYHGTRPLFEKMGFVVTKNLGKTSIMRKYLGDQ
ncbi:MAG TPA: GNAT family N-acetyltransferase [Oscillospiraceae bacterium]|nr:GNAT family N-acetyltransferase [Oscillospiraceae bacterium]HPF56034.1 GNAT family N-acetyltransferase [Clostridiales bacterium]HPK35031.1 GNAT family N-acetyltransferase [Oscillospiraceae bacterium]HPR76280.1 GNAT family N-acetyltransferase [Oscillospiraceae bacterium]